MSVASPSAYRRLRDQIDERRRTPEFARFIRYAMVSVISTVLSLIILYLFYRVAKLVAWEANVVATIICTVPGYYLNRTWAWGKVGKSHFMREVLPFWVIAFISLGLSTCAVQLADHETNNLSHFTQTIVVLFANFFTYGVIWIGKFILFNKVLFKNDADFEPVVLVPASGVPQPVVASSGPED